MPDQIGKPTGRTVSMTAPIWAAVLFGAAALAVYYTLLLANLHLSPLGPEQYDHVFGNMLRHMLHGRFDVDASAIDSESFTRDGRTYAYFGIFPAVLRLLAMPFADPETAGLARLSCLVAMLLYVGIQLRTLCLVHNALPGSRRSSALLIIMVVAIALSGPQLYLLGSAWIFHEPVFWGGAIGAAFNFVVLRRVLAGQALTTSDFAMLAMLAGVALNTRASVGAGLCVATGLLVLWHAWTTRSVRALADRRVMAALVLLTLFVAVACVVNYGRWGNPLKFADFRYYDYAHRQPWRLAVILDQGELAPNRIPIAMLYYGTGLPYLLKHSPLFLDYLRTHFDGLEAPPTSGLLTNPLIIILAGLGLFRIVRDPPPGAAILRLVLVGHAATMMLVFSAMYLALRYRMDLAPFMTLSAFIGYPVLSAAFVTTRRHRLLLGAAILLCVGGVASSHYLLVVYKVTSFGVPRAVRMQLHPYAPFVPAPDN